MLRAFYFLAISGLFTFQFAQAATSCSINKNSGDGLYNEFVKDIEVVDSDDQDATQLIYIKSDASIVRLNYGEVKSKQDWSDLDKSTFFTFKSHSGDSLEVGYGDVDVSREDVRKLISVADAEKKLVLWAGDNYVAFCMPKGRGQSPAMLQRQQSLDFSR